MSGLTIVSREQWGAQAPRTAHTKITGAVTYAFIHHTATPSCTGEASKARVQSIQNHHMNTNKWDDIGYSFLIDGDGVVFQGRGWGVVGAHTKGYNSQGYGIAILGNFATASPSAEALESAKRLIAAGVSDGYLRSDYKVVGHRDVCSTECPGNALYSIIKTWPHFGK
ncbi:unnamed protein product [Calicophoron daubneyi]|uniref:Peptidoglycan-recognition protein n=1 Tax=Calicophoron daubneyi TaxID=300641 RepID=A0AAV2U1J6_CALDB